MGEMLLNVVLFSFYWIVGGIITFTGCCAIASFLSLALSFIWTLGAWRCWVNVMTWTFFLILFSAGCFFLQWLEVLVGNYTDHRVQYAVFVGMVFPGLIGLTAFPQLIRQAIKANSDIAQGKIYNPDE
jgi:hypothetical protein